MQIFTKIEKPKKEIDLVERVITVCYKFVKLFFLVIRDYIIKFDF
jgi:hypothetical protein